MDAAAKIIEKVFKSNVPQHGLYIGHTDAECRRMRAIIRDMLSTHTSQAVATSTTETIETVSGSSITFISLPAISTRGGQLLNQRKIHHVIVDDMVAQDKNGQKLLQQLVSKKTQKTKSYKKPVRKTARKPVVHKKPVIEPKITVKPKRYPAS